MDEETPKSGPEPDRLKIDGKWQDAVKKALRKGKPPPAQKPKRKPQGK